MCLPLFGILLSEAYGQVGVPPVIYSQPSDQTVINGGTASFTVRAFNGLLSYQWYKAPNKKFNGQTSSTLTIPNVSSSDEGQYFVEVRNAAGKTNSS